MIYDGEGFKVADIISLEYESIDTAFYTKNKVNDLDTFPLLSEKQKCKPKIKILQRKGSIKYCFTQPN